MDLDQLVPHRSPARIIERMVSADDGGAKAEFYVQKGPWLRAGALGGEALIEALAQTAAVYAGALALRRGRGPIPGVLAAVSKFRFPTRAVVGDKVETEVRLETVLGEIAAFEGIARVGEREVARGEMRVALTGL